MSIQIEFEWEKDNLTETMLFLMDAQPKTWTQYLEGDDGVVVEPSLEAFENILFKQLWSVFRSKNRTGRLDKDVSLVEPLLRPIWMSCVMTDKVVLEADDQIFGSFRVHGHLGLLDSGFRATRVITLESEKQRQIAAKLMLLTKL